jgi:hypothetical protein
MNERIREFAEKCEGIMICECGETGFNYEKFAELIVKECAQMADFADKNPGDYVLKHFGVEE